jgi:hypothetical protein
METKSKLLLAQDKHMESLRLVIEGKQFWSEVSLVIKRKEYAMGRDDPQYVVYVTEIVKVFNQVGMHQMNLGRHKVSLDIFRSLVRFLSG